MDKLVFSFFSIISWDKKEKTKREKKDKDQIFEKMTFNEIESYTEPPKMFTKS